MMMQVTINTVLIWRDFDYSQNNCFKGNPKVHKPRRKPPGFNEIAEKILSQLVSFSFTVLYIYVTIDKNRLYTVVFAYIIVGDPNKSNTPTYNI